MKETRLEEYFKPFRRGIVGVDMSFNTPYGRQDVVYADWIASGRLYGPIEDKLSKILGPFVSNPHSYSSYTGQKVTKAYNEARKIIKQHVNAHEDDVLVTTGSGMTGALMRLQEIMGLKRDMKSKEGDKNRPVVFITHMEHHSNHVSWMEVDADVVVLSPGDEVLVDPAILESTIQKYSDRKIKIGAFTACSNVTGIIAPYYELAEIMHQHGGLCIVDFAASAPYVEIDMHPENLAQNLDAVCFSPHKFLGGPGACGILVCGKELHNGTPTVPGGGNVKWTDPWGNYGYTNDVEAMEDGGTPGFMQAIRAALAMQLKDKMGVGNMQAREEELLEKAIGSLVGVDGFNMVGSPDLSIKRIGALSFNIKNLHYNLVVRLLNDRFGIQARGGWSCASTYCHFLFDMDEDDSSRVTTNIKNNDMTGKPGWVRISLHPTMLDQELDFIIASIKEIIESGEEWAESYYYETTNNEYYGKSEELNPPVDVSDIFN